MDDVNYLSVKEFADATGRFPNQIYDLINKGNKFRKLKVTLIEGRIKVPDSELTEFPFNATVKAQIEAQKRIEHLEERLAEFEEKENINGV